MVVDVDEDFSFLDGGSTFAQTFETCAIGGDNTVKFFAAMRPRHQAVGIEKSQFVGNRILVPAGDFLSFVLEGVSNGKLGADAIAIGPDMADDAKRFVFANFLDNAADDLGGGFHSGGEGLSSSSRISSTRLPRSIESSMINLSAGVYLRTTARPRSPCIRLRSVSSSEEAF